MKAKITEEGIEIESMLISEQIFQKEMIEWILVEREEQIDRLIDWISESTRDGDKFAMKEDLKYLISIPDEYIFSSISTNKFIAKSDNEEEFDNICKEILKLNKSL